MSDAAYSYPDTGVLRNKLNIRESYELFGAEADLTFHRLRELQLQPLKGCFDFQHLCDIHKYIFQDVYTWAGEIRSVDIGKGNLFCRASFIPSYAQDVFRTFARDCYAARDDKDKFVHVLAEHYGNMNALHPFREGNGRAQREFTRELCARCGYEFDLSCTVHEEMLKASILSFNKLDNSGLEAIFQRAVSPLDPAYQPDYLKILSKDDLPETIGKKTLSQKQRMDMLQEELPVTESDFSEDYDIR